MVLYLNVIIMKSDLFSNLAYIALESLSSLFPYFIVYVIHVD